MPRPCPCPLAAVLILLPACNDKPISSSRHSTTTTIIATPSPTTVIATTTNTGDLGPAERSAMVGHVRVTIKKVSIGKVPLKAADGSITYAEEPRLMIALRIENVSDKKRSEYHTWVPDLEAAKIKARLTDDGGTELKRVTFGFGNNVKDRTVLDTLTPGKVIGDLLVFEAPAPGWKTLKLELPGANCGVTGTFTFAIDPSALGWSGSPR